MIAQLEEDLVHLEGGGQRLDQHGGADRALGQAEHALGGDEDIAPEPRLEMALHLRQIEIGPEPCGERRLGVVEDIEAEIEQRARHRLAVDLDMRLRQMPAARPDDQHGGLWPELVGLAGRRIREAERALPARQHVRLALDHVGQGRRVGVLEIGHEDLGAGVQRVDHHLLVGRAGDLDAAVEEIGGRRARRASCPRELPTSRAGSAAARQRRTASAARCAPQPLSPLALEGAMQTGEEGQRLAGQDVLGPRRDGRLERQALGQCHRVRHRAPRAWKCDVWSGASTPSGPAGRGRYLPCPATLSVSRVR